MTKSKQTKKYCKLAIIFTVLSVLLLLGPTSYYVILGFISAELVVEKLALASAVFVSIILTLLCAINKWTFRSKIWLVVLSLFFVIDQFLVMIFIFGTTQITDELIVTPLAKHFRNKASINREIDKRTGE